MQSLNSEPGATSIWEKLETKKEMVDFVVSEARQFLNTLLSLETPHIPVYGLTEQLTALPLL